MKDNSKTDYVSGYMYDLWLFSVGAKFSDADVLKADKLMFHTAEYKGGTDFAFPICDSSGVFISITSALGEVGGTLFIKKSEKQEPPYFAPPWLDPDDSADVHYVDVDDEYKEAVTEAVRAAVEMSPVRKVYMLIRRQCRGRKNMIGMLTVEEIRKLFDDDRILGNIVYEIYDKPDCLRDYPPSCPQVIPEINCDMVLTGSSGCRDEVTDALQMKSTSAEGDWRISTGNVRCLCSDQVTAIMLRLIPGYLRGRFSEIKRKHGLRSVMTLRISCEAPSFPFVVLDRPLIGFLLSTDTELVLSVEETGEKPNVPDFRLRLDMSGQDLAFDRIEEYTGKTPWFRKRQAEFPVQVRDTAKDSWTYRSEGFPWQELKDKARIFCNDFSDERLSEIPYEECTLELNIYCEEGLRFESVIPQELLRLADRFSAAIHMGRYGQELT